MTDCFKLVDDTRLKYIKLCFDENNSSSVIIKGVEDAEYGNSDIDFVWILMCGFMVMLMQLGFTLLEAGAVRYKNTLNIMFKNFVDFCLGALVWYFCGWALISAPSNGSKNEFMGSGDATLEDSKDYLNWFFSMVFAATAATIVSGAVAERATLQSYLLYSFAITAWVYPIVAYWVWGDGVFSQGKEYEVIDFAGSGVVHMVGGFSGLVGAFFIGPRKGKPVPHSVAFQVIGVFILFFGWFGFNCGSTLQAHLQMKRASRVAVTTTLSACTSGLASVFIAKVIEGVFSVERMGNGILAGLVGITAGCHVVEPWGAILVGAVSAIVYYAASKLMVLLGIDDPLDAAAVHGFAGFWGVLACAFFGTKDFIDDAEYANGGKFGLLFRNQFCGALAIMMWTLANSGILFGILYLSNNLRVDGETEKLGLNVKHSSRTAGPWQFQSASDLELENVEMSPPKRAPNHDADELGGEATDFETGTKPDEMMLN